MWRVNGQKNTATKPALRKRSSSQSSKHSAGISSTLQGREPDYALFASASALDRALDAGRKDEELWAPATLVADAKAWHVRLDRPSRVGARREYPPEQIEWYLDRSRKAYGLLTNGSQWRLVPRVLGPNKPRFQTYLEADLVRILEDITPPTEWVRRPPPQADAKRRRIGIGRARFADRVETALGR